MSNVPPPTPPALWRNPLSLFGGFVTIAATAFGLPMMFLDIFTRHSDPYTAILIYLILPGVAVGGVVLVALGMWWEYARRRRHPGTTPPPLPRLDLNEPRHQAVVAASLFGLMVLAILLAITGYRSYHVTESVKFCGVVCHQVMKPEYTAYQYSPHARVACVQCHVGPGAEWYVRSKLNGLHQVYSVVTKTYPKPIATPVHNLRPAQETCEQCHWPAKFFGAQQKTFRHYLSDETNSPWDISMLIRVGGGDPAHGGASGIHWHMNIAKTIEYIAADARREVIPWVRVTDQNGRVTVYQSTEQPLTEAQIAGSEIRRMDCVDCHNRPSHIYWPPDRSVEQAMERGLIDARLPYVKREAVRLLAADYATETEALKAIRQGLAAYYETSYPELIAERREIIQAAAEETARIYARTIFPEMKADWRAHPNHLGHLNSPGCFRCHDGLHQSAEGKIITKDCNACHTILAQGPAGEVAQTPLQEQSFRHPVDLGMDVTELKCSDCHNGTSGL